MSGTVGVIICAAGKGFRAGFEKNKLLVPLQGERVLKKTLSAFDYPAVSQIVVTSSQADMQEITELCRTFPRTRVVLGGETRTQSVYNGLRALNTDIVLIHDGARPFVTRKTIDGCIQSVISYGSGVCAVDCLDTIAVCADGCIQSVPNRNSLQQIQTPQGFLRETITLAYEKAFQDGAHTFTDDSSVYAAYVGAPCLCAGARENIKLTYAEDFDKTPRCGFGVDTHAFGKQQDYILLAGVKIPSDSGLIAHSDGDVLVHALMDALLSAAGLKDIGFYFPDSSTKWKDANSMEMLKQVLLLLDERGYQTQNVSIAVQAEKPRLAKYIDEMKIRLAQALRIDPTAVGITAGTNEGLGYVGEGKGITVSAYVLLQRK